MKLKKKIKRSLNKRPKPALKAVAKRIKKRKPGVSRTKTVRKRKQPVMSQGQAAFNNGYDTGFTQGFAQGMQDGQSYLQP